MHIHDHLGAGAAGYVVELDGRDCFAHLCQRTGGRPEVGFEVDLLRNAQQLPLLLEHRKELAEVLVSPHRLRKDEDSLSRSTERLDLPFFQRGGTNYRCMPGRM